MDVAKKFVISRYRQLLKDSLYRNTMSLIVSTFILSGAGFLFWLIMAHRYSSTQVGLATALVSAMNLLVNLSLMGFENAVIRYMPKTKNKSEMISSGLTTVTIVSAVASISYLFIVHFFIHRLAFIDSDHIAMFAFVLFTILATINQVLEGIFVSFKKAEWVLIKNTLLSILKLILPFFIIVSTADGIFSIYSASTTVAVIICLAVLIKKFSIRLKIGIKSEVVSKLARYSLGNYVSAFFNNLAVLVLPLIVVTRIGGKQEAYFYIALMIANLLFLIPTAIAQSLLSEIAHDESGAKSYITKAYRISFVILIPLLLIILVGGKYVLELFGKKFGVEGFHSLIIFSLSSIPVLDGYVYMTLLRIKHKITDLVYINLFGALLIISSAWVVAPHGLVAVAWSWSIGQIAIAVLFYVDYRIFE